VSTSWSVVAAIAAAGRSAQLMAAEELLRSRRLPRWYPPAIDTCRAQPGSAAKGADGLGGGADVSSASSRSDQPRQDAALSSRGSGGRKPRKSGAAKTSATKIAGLEPDLRGSSPLTTSRVAG